MHRLVSSLAVVVVVVCAGCTSSPGRAPGVAAPAPMAVVAEHAAYTVAAATTCGGAPCTLGLRVTARAGFHGNAEYPHRFVPDAGSVVVDDAARVRRVDGDLVEVTESYQPSIDGVVRGRLFMSVCSDETCLIEKVPIALPSSSP